MMRILLIGGDGQVGWELRRSLVNIGTPIIYTRKDLDLENIDSVLGALALVSPDIIVNAAAYTEVDRAEKEPEQAKRINSEAPAILAEYAKKNAVLLVHYSTDYVFDGAKQAPYTEDDPTNPLSIYGQTKLDGDLAIMDSGCRHIIFRTSWVYSHRGRNFVKTMIKLAQEREWVSIVDDQIGSPTNAKFIAETSANCIRKAWSEDISGLFNLSAGGEVSWHGLSQFIISKMNSIGMNTKLRLDDILAIKTADYNYAAARPLYSKLDTKKIQENFGIEIPFWQEGVKFILKKLTNINKY